MSSATAVEAGPAPSTTSFPGGVTVLMAVYHGDDPELFARAVASVYANSLKPDGFVLVVDGPVPEMLSAIIERVCREQPIRVVRLEQNRGLAHALNEGLAHVNTAWVARADADDLNMPNRFEAQAHAIAESGDRLDLIGAAILEVDRDNQPLAVRRVPLAHEDIARRLRTRNPFNHMTVAFRTAIVRDAGGYPDLHLKEDYGLWATLVARGARCRNLDVALVRATTGRAMYRRRGGLKVARSEWDLQRHLHRQGCTSAASALMAGSLRAAACCLPSGVRGLLYERLLRAGVTERDQ